MLLKGTTKQSWQLAWRNQSKAFVGTPYCSACAVRSSTSFGKTASNSCRVVFCAMITEQFYHFAIESSIVELLGDIESLGGLGGEE